MEQQLFYMSVDFYCGGDIYRKRLALRVLYFNLVPRRKN